MADVKVCDRCGKKLTDERSTFNVKQAKPTTTRFVLSASLFKKPNYWGEQNIVNTEHDLCMECTLALSEWMQINNTEEKV